VFNKFMKVYVGITSRDFGILQTISCFCW